MVKMSTVLAVAVTAVLGAGVSASAAAVSNPLQVDVQVLDGKAGTLFGAVEVTVTNTGRQAVRIPRWQLPADVSDMPQFQVLRNGAPVPYVGRLVKRGAPKPADFVVLAPGKSVSNVIDLSSTYDMTRAGEYKVMYAVSLRGAQLNDGRSLHDPQRATPLQLNSYPKVVQIEDGGQFAAMHAARDRGRARPTAQVEGVSYLNCSSSQASGIASAVKAARNYTDNAYDYLTAGTSGARYTTWFGAVTSARHNTVRSNFNAIDEAMDQDDGEITINCGCNEDFYAYVYPDQPYEIYVCNAFWRAPNTGTDSRAGTLVHEMSHFTNVADTNDFAYGHDNAKDLAITDPDLAIYNADSHEYFAENTPEQSKR